MTKEERRRKYAELYTRIPGRTIGEKLDWIQERFFCQRLTARIWNMKQSDKPMPESKLRLMEMLLDKEQEGGVA